MDIHQVMHKYEQTEPLEFPVATGRAARRRSGPANNGDFRLARALGWFSIGLGLAELAAPRSLARAVGFRNGGAMMPALGLREMASGIGILSAAQPAGWMWTRVLGDAMDLGLLGAALRTTRRQKERQRTLTAAAAVAGVTALDLFCAQQLQRRRSGRKSLHRDRALRVERCITVNRPVEECYRFWRDFQNLPRFMAHVEAVQGSGERTHWIVKGPAGRRLEWDAEIINDVPNEVIAWRSLENADVESTGAVRFSTAPNGRGTIVEVKMNYRPPGGVVGSWVAKLLGEDPDVEIQEDLRRFKQVLETGEVLSNDGPRGPRSRIGRAM